MDYLISLHRKIRGSARAVLRYHCCISRPDTPVTLTRVYGELALRTPDIRSKIGATNRQDA